MRLCGTSTAAAHLTADLIVRVCQKEFGDHLAFPFYVRCLVRAAVLMMLICEPLMSIAPFFRWCLVSFALISAPTIGLVRSLSVALKTIYQTFSLKVKSLGSKAGLNTAF